VTHGEHHPPADHRQHQDAEQDADEADVQAHVAIEDVAELMGDHTLQFGTVEGFQCTPGHGHGRVGGAVAGREGVYARFLLQYIDSGTGTPAAMAISSTTLRSRRFRGSVVSGSTSVPPSSRATVPPPLRRPRVR
jgi:hypothetical protein